MAKKKTKRADRLEGGLVLHHYLLSRFGVNSLEELAEGLKEAKLEGFEEDNISKLHFALLQKLTPIRHREAHLLTDAELLRYDLNIYTHTAALNAGRERPITWKYFQYLALLFTEVYLDRYFNDKAGLLDDLNSFVASFNQKHQLNQANFAADELNRLAFWNATGSGKTLLMHINIRQFRHYQAKADGTAVNRTLLVTSDEALSRQHIAELRASGLIAASFRKEGTIKFIEKDKIEVIEIQKLQEKDGNKRIDVAAFEDNNLVLIDEAHQGIKGDQWKDMRERPGRNGFTFEYSATFGQAVNSTPRQERADHIDEYGKSILFDYSYRFFYADGYGKEFRILNIAAGHDRGEARRRYLTGALLSFYQQKMVFAGKEADLMPYLIADPLWVFVGNSVTGNEVRTEKGKQVSDVLTIVQFFKTFVQSPDQARRDITAVLNGSAGLMDEKGISVFDGKFPFLSSDSSAIYVDVLKRVFSGAVAGAGLKMEKLGGSDGELGLRIGDAEDYFGLINIGDVPKFINLAKSHDLEVGEKEFTSSLFDGINDPGSPINILIGAKKFTTGWNSWRVSTMGLMKVGGGEGSTIIQLFGRGVRLKGYDFSLKRSKALDKQLRPSTAPPVELPLLETLNIFGIRADYMAQFRDYLEKEGVSTEQDKYQEAVILPIKIPTVTLEKAQLKILAPDESADFRSAVRFPLKSEKFWKTNLKPVTLDWYPRVQTFTRIEATDTAVAEEREPIRLDPIHLALLDWDTVYLEVQTYKRIKGYDNCYFDTTSLRSILYDLDFYQLYIPASELEATGKSSLRLRHELVATLLKSYLDKYYRHRRAAYQAEHLQLRVLTPEHDNFYEQYEVEVKRGEEQIAESLQRIKAALAEADPVEWTEELVSGLSVYNFGQHLYQPLIYLNEKQIKDLVKVSPVALNKGEHRFVEDIKNFYLNEQERGEEGFFSVRSLYLLRNRSRKGVGFFENNNFYPDFILWLVEGDFQYIVFVDPKGIRNLRGMDDPKLNLHLTLGETIEPRLEDPGVALDAYIISNTKFDQVDWWTEKGMQEFNDRHVYFQQDQRNYIELMFSDIISCEQDGESR